MKNIKTCEILKLSHTLLFSNSTFYILNSTFFLSLFLFFPFFSFAQSSGTKMPPIPGYKLSTPSAIQGDKMKMPSMPADPSFPGGEVDNAAGGVSTPANPEGLESSSGQISSNIKGTTSGIEDPNALKPRYDDRKISYGTEADQYGQRKDLRIQYKTGATGPIDYTGKRKVGTPEALESHVVEKETKGRDTSREWGLGGPLDSPREWGLKGLND